MSTSSPCAACKFLRRKCTQECVFAPYFPPDQPQKFACVHKVFGASNVAKLLNEIAPGEREDAVNSLYYEAEARIRDPVYGCVGLISILQQRMKQLQRDLETSKKELASHIGPQALVPLYQLPQSPNFLMLPPLETQNYHLGKIPSSSLLSIPTGQPLFIRDQQHQQQHQQIFEAQQLQQHQEMFYSGYGQNQTQILRFNDGFNSAIRPSGTVTITGINNTNGMLPSLALGTYDDTQLQQDDETQLLSQPIQTSETQTQQPNSDNEEKMRNVIGQSG